MPWVDYPTTTKLATHPRANPSQWYWIGERRKSFHASTEHPYRLTRNQTDPPLQPPGLRHYLKPKKTLETISLFSFTSPSIVYI